MRSLYLAALVTLALLSQAQADPPKHPLKSSELDRAVPPLDPNRVRLVIYTGRSESAGSAEFSQLSGTHETGQIFLNDRAVGTMAKGSYFVVDVMPGRYEAQWIPDEPEKGVYVEPENFTFVAGETRYLTCNLKAPIVPISALSMLPIVGGAVGGAIMGAAEAKKAAAANRGTADNFSKKAIIRDRPMEKDTRFVSYTKSDFGAKPSDANQVPQSDAALKGPTAP